MVRTLAPGEALEIFSERSVLTFNGRWIIAVGYRGDDVRGRAINRHTGAVHEYRFISVSPETFHVGPHEHTTRGTDCRMIREHVERGHTPDGTTPRRPGRQVRWKLKQMMLEANQKGPS